MCDLFLGESDEEIELEVEEYDSEENVVLEEDVEDMTNENPFADEHMAAACFEERRGY